MRRVASSETFEKSPRLRAFFLHVCRCALEDKSEEATEQQIGIFVYGRPPGYNPNDDNIVRSQARVLRMKLEHHFANEGRDEPYVITIPKGRYLPTFEPRAVVQFPGPKFLLSRSGSLVQRLGSGSEPPLYWPSWRLGSATVSTSRNPNQTDTADYSTTPMVPDNVPAQEGSAPSQMTGGLRWPAKRATFASPPAIPARPYVDVWGNRWDADRYFQGGVVQPGPKRFFPPRGRRGTL